VGKDPFQAYVRAGAGGTVHTVVVEAPKDAQYYLAPDALSPVPEQRFEMVPNAAIDMYIK